MRVMVLLCLLYLAVFLVFSATGASGSFLRAYSRWIQKPVLGVLALYLGQILFWPVFLLEYVKRTDNPAPLLIMCALFLVVWLV